MKVLMLSYYFPPMGMGGTQRPAKFAKFLPLFGWQPTVVTVKPIYYWAQDDSLLDELAHVRIVRTESFDPQRLLWRFGKRLPKVSSSESEKKGQPGFKWLNQSILPLVLVPDSKVLWHGPAFREINLILEREHFDLLYTTSPPHSVHLLGKKIAQKYRIKWVADFRDSWAKGVVVREPTRFHRFLNKQLQKTVVRLADAVVCASPGIAQALEKSDCVVIPNGFDPDDFLIRPDLQQSAYFKFCHCGTNSEFSNPEVLFQSLVILRDRQPDVARKIRFSFIGYDANGGLDDLVGKYRLQDWVNIIGYVSHGESLTHLLSSNALVLIALGKPGSTFIPGKTFEYLAADKPILAITDVKDTRDLLSNDPLTMCLAPNHPEKIAESIVAFLRNPLKTTPGRGEFIAQFDRKKQTEKLTNLFNSLEYEK